MGCRIISFIIIMSERSLGLLGRSGGVVFGCFVGGLLVNGVLGGEYTV